MDAQLVEKWNELCGRLQSTGYDSLSSAEKLWLVTRELIDSTNNGGMISYFYNSGADHLDDCVAALRQLGMEGVHEQVLRVCRLFQTGVPATVSTRNEIIESWDGTADDLLQDIDDAVFSLFPDLERRLDKFVSDNILQNS